MIMKHIGKEIKDDDLSPDLLQLANSHSDFLTAPHRLVHKNFMHEAAETITFKSVQILDEYVKSLDNNTMSHT